MKKLLLMLVATFCFAAFSKASNPPGVLVSYGGTYKGFQLYYASAYSLPKNSWRVEWIVRGSDGVYVFNTYSNETRTPDFPPIGLINLEVKVYDGSGNVLCVLTSTCHTPSYSEFVAAVGWAHPFYDPINARE